MLEILKGFFYGGFIVMPLKQFEQVCDTLLKGVDNQAHSKRGNR